MSRDPTPTTSATMEEKIQTLFQDQALRNAQRRKDASTFLSHTHTDEGGRFAKPQTVVGTDAAPQYPRQPEGSFSNQAAVVGPEEPLGFSIEEVPIVGEPGEVEASAGSLDDISEVEPPPTNPGAFSRSASLKRRKPR